MLHSESTIKQHFIILAMCMVFPEHHIYISRKYLVKLLSSVNSSVAQFIFKSSYAQKYIDAFIRICCRNKVNDMLFVRWNNGRWNYDGYLAVI